MGLHVSQTGTPMPPAPEGTFKARCVQVIDLGTQHSAFYDSSRPKVLLAWELPEAMTDQNEPFLVWKRYTASLNEKAALRQDLESWRGRAFTTEELEGFSLKNVLDKPCLVNIAHRKADKGNAIYANVKAVMALPGGTEVAPRQHDLILYDLDDPDKAVWDTFSEGLQQTISRSPEWQEKNQSPAGGAPVTQDAVDHEELQEDDIPF